MTLRVALKAGSCPPTLNPHPLGPELNKPQPVLAEKSFLGISQPARLGFKRKEIT